MTQSNNPKDSKLAYEPRESDLDWARNLVAHMKDGGLWGAPATGLIYQFNHRARTITMVSPESLLDTSFQAFVMHEQTRIVFGKIGYTMIEPQGEGHGDTH